MQRRVAGGHVLATDRGDVELRGADPRAPWGDSTPPPPSAGGGSIAGTTVNESTALQVAAVYGSVSVISDALASLPIDLMSTPHRRTGQLLKPSQLVTQPFEEISAQDWWTQFAISLALRGNFYGQIVQRDGDLYPTQIRPVHPDHVQVRRYRGAVEYRFNGLQVPLDDVFHVRYLSVAESLVGLNPVEYLRNIIGGARAADMYGNAFYQNSALPSLALVLEGDYDEDEAKSLKQEWMQLHGGIGAAQLPAVLTGGTTIETLSITPEDAQFLETRQYTASTISGQIFRVPPHMIGIVDRTTSWGTGIEQQEMGFVRNTLIGYLSRGERALTAVHPPGQFVRFDLSERLRGDRLQRAQANALEISSGYLLPDEARADEDRPPLPGGIGQTAMAPINAQSLKAMATQSIADAQQQQQQSPSQKSANDGNDAQRAEVALAEQRERTTQEMLKALRQPIDLTVNSSPVTVEPSRVSVEPHIDVHPAEPHVTVENRVDPTPVNVAAPAVTVEAPSVSVAAPDVHVEPRINVEPADVTVNLPAQKGKTTVLRDKDGRILGTETE